MGSQHRMDKEVRDLLNDAREVGGYFTGWVEDFSKFEENLRVLTGVSYVTRTSRSSR